LKELTRIQEELAGIEHLTSEVATLSELAELAETDGDSDVLAEVDLNLNQLLREIRSLELSHMLSGPDDHRNAILDIHPGAGGTESMDWAEMLTRMYQRWCEARGFQWRTLDLLPGEEAGVKSMSAEVAGRNAYGYLKAERGVHRLVRLSPFDANHRRHTSFASVFVYPAVDDEITVQVDESDLRIDTYRASGAGGQHVNKTSSAVRITHITTGIVVQCQNERSQFRNKENAMKILLSKLYQRKVEEEEAKRAELHAEKSDIAWGSQIRSYVLHPYSLVKDHRTGVEIGNVQGVLDGEIHRFIEAFLLHATDTRRM
jgi:peptide chain release factor 2